MDWLESQVEMRGRLDREQLERSYAELGASIASPSSGFVFTSENTVQADDAIKLCLGYCGATPGDVPDGVEGLEDRVSFMCRPSGTMYRHVRLEKQWYLNAFGALLGTLDTGQTVALLPYGARRYFYYDPTTMRRVKVNMAVAAHIKEEALFFYKALPARPLKVTDLVSFIMHIFDVGDYLLVLFAGIAATLIGFLPAWANNIAFGMVVPSRQARLIVPICCLLLGVAISTELIGLYRRLVMQRVSTKLEVTTSAAAFARVLTLPSSFFRKYASGDIASRVANITSLVQNIASLLLGSGLSALLSLAYLIQITHYVPSLALPALVIVLTQAVLTVVATQLAMRYERMAMEGTAELSGLVTALLGGIQKIKLAGAEDRAFAKWAHKYAAYAKNTYNRPILVRALPAVVALDGLVGTILLYYIAGTHGVSVADYMAFNVTYGQMSGAIMMLANSAAEAARIRPMLDVVAPILEAEPEAAEGKPGVKSLTGAIEVSDVSFRYSPNMPYVVDNLSFKIKPGEYVALVGKSGSGKSTIMRLLLGFEKPERGAIFYGRYDVSKVDLQSLRRCIGTVMQDGKLFLGDMLNNITISSPLATIDDAWRAAEIAGIADDIRKMPMGMQTLVTEGGGSISGGQRQRIMIARAVCGERKIIMFDEATSALDNLTQRHVADALGELKCTRLVIAHRLSTVRHCDRILVVDGGRIAEEGTYDELIARNGLFAELVARQRIDTKSDSSV